ncbi:ACT domain-containing protein [Oscillospiraceae bacterium MB08-C2-2]|nr:ACT domain-containing protein [Oscillospiraceae bacterium MB08-C2-2]
MNGNFKLYTTEDVTLVTFNDIPASLSLIADIFGKFADHQINIDMISQTSPVRGSVSISFTCSDADMIKVLEIARSMGEKNPSLKPMVSSSNCKLQIYGEEMRDFSGVFSKAVSTLAEASVEIQQITTSEIDISLLVAACDFAEASGALEKAFGISE